MKLFSHKKKKNNDCKIMEQSNLIPIGDPVLNQKAIFLGKGKIIFGENVNIGYFPSPLFYSTYAHIEARNATSRIYIGENTYISNNSYIVSNGTEIKIGKNCRIGINFQCLDSDFHGLSPETRDNSEFIINKPVTIGDNVFIGNNVTILKGVSIGQNAVIGAGSVVTKDIPENVIGAGNPCKILKKLKI